MSKQRKTKHPRSLLSQILILFAFVVLIVLVTVAIIAGIGWWAGWQTEGKFKIAIQIAGLIQIGVGFLGIKGNRDNLQRIEAQVSKSVPKDDHWNSAQQSMKDFAQKYAFLLVMFASGGLCMVIGWLM